MWEFPRAAETDLRTLHDLVGPAELEPIGSVRHSVTRHRITLAVKLAHVSERFPRLDWLTEPELAERPMPSPQRKAFALVQRRATSLL
jgi:hypothetical protein